MTSDVCPGLAAASPRVRLRLVPGPARTHRITSPAGRALTAVLLAAAWGLTAAAPPPAIEVQSAQARLDFPNRIVFTLQASGQAPFQTVEVEYGLETTACATDINRASPAEVPQGDTLEVSWTWDMRRSGSLPPGAQIWWRWHLVDANGEEIRTPTQRLTWIDGVHPWRSLSAGGLVLHWYAGTQAAAQQLLDAALHAEDRLKAEIGDLPAGQVDFFVYDSSDAMREAILFEPSWTGGLAFPEYRIVILGIGENDLDWGLGAIAHEFAHVVVGNVVSHCYSSMPAWLNEGLAMIAQGGPDRSSLDTFQQAVKDDRLFSVRALSGGFSEDPTRASLAYAESYSLVSFLTKQYGQAKMKDLLATLQAGYRYDHALQSVYDFDADGLEAAWREWIGAAPSAGPSASSEATPTLPPTLVPLVGPPLAATSTPVPTSVPEPPTSGSQALVVALECFGLLVLAACPAVALVGVFLFVARRRARAAGPPGQKHD